MKTKSLLLNDSKHLIYFLLRTVIEHSDNHFCPRQTDERKNVQSMYKKFYKENHLLGELMNISMTIFIVRGSIRRIQRCQKVNSWGLSQPLRYRGQPLLWKYPFYRIFRMWKLSKLPLKNSATLIAKTCIRKFFQGTTLSSSVDKYLCDEWTAAEYLCDTSTKYAPEGLK